MLGAMNVLAIREGMCARWEQAVCQKSGEFHEAEARRWEEKTEGVGWFGAENSAIMVRPDGGDPL